MFKTTEPLSWLGPLISVEHHNRSEVLRGMKLLTSDGNVGWADAREGLTGMTCYRKRVRTI